VFRNGAPLGVENTSSPSALCTTVVIQAHAPVEELDPLLDDSLFMASRGHAAGNEAQLVICPESIHGLIAFPRDIAMLSLVQQAEILRRHLAFAPA
jgi:acetyl esterase/lipase